MQGDAKAAAEKRGSPQCRSSPRDQGIGHGRLSTVDAMKTFIEKREKKIRILCEAGPSFHISIWKPMALKRGLGTEIEASRAWSEALRA
jgi:hypothetical protein